MKILICIATMRAGGAERTTAALANEFIINNQVTILTLDHDVSFYKLDEKIHHIPLGICKESRSKGEAVLNNLNYIFQIRKIIKKLQPDAILCMTSTMWLIGYLAKLFLKARLVGSERSNPYRDTATGIWKQFKKLGALLCDGMIFQTERAQKYYTRSVQKKSIVIPNGIWNQDIEDIPYYEEKEKKICGMGRLIELKGFDTLIKAFAEVSSKISDYKLVIYGEGPERKNLEKLIKELKVEDKVELPGIYENAICEIAKAKVFVLSSRYEGMPNALIEAMACGVACIATDCEMGPRELIEQEKNGILVPTDHISRMSGAMYELISDSEKARRISENAYQIRTKLSASQIANRYYQYLKKYRFD